MRQERGYLVTKTIVGTGRDHIIYCYQYISRPMNSKVWRMLWVFNLILERLPWVWSRIIIGDLFSWLDKLQKKDFLQKWNRMRYSMFPPRPLEGVHCDLRGLHGRWLSDWRRGCHWKALLAPVQLAPLTICYILLLQLIMPNQVHKK